MVGVIFCLALTSSACWFGFEFASLFVYAHIDPFTRLGIGMPWGVVVMGWIFYVLNLYFEFSEIFGVTVMLLLALIALALRLIFKRTGHSRRLPTLLLSFSVFVPTAFLCFVMFYSILFGEVITRGAVYGDLPFHLNIITSFVYGCNKNRESLFGNLSPFFANEPLAYPVIPDYLSSIMIGCFGTSIRWSLLIPSFPFAYSLFAMLSRLVTLFTRRETALLFAPWVFLFMGGLGFTCTFNRAVLIDANADMVHSWGLQRYEYWFHPILHVLLPQRLSLFSMPLCWSYIYLLLSKGHKWPKFLFCGLIVAVLPQVQGHSLITLLEWTFGFAVINFRWQFRKLWKDFRNYIILGIPALGIGIPQLLPFFGRVAQTNFVTLNPIWADDRITFWRLWWRGLGVFWVVSIFLCWTVFDWRQAKLYFPSLLVFGISNWIHYQPWNLDNTKVFYNGWVPLAVAAFCTFISRIERNRFEAIIRTIIVATSMSSALLGFVKAMATNPRLFDPVAGVAIAHWAIKHTPPKSVWVTDTHHNHPIPMLAGRQILVGYRGWMPSHNLNDHNRVSAMESLGKDSENTAAIDKFHPDYICFDLLASDELKFRFHAHSRKWKLMHRSQYYEVWQRIK
jgi:hypothetical protein